MNMYGIVLSRQMRRENVFCFLISEEFESVAKIERKFDEILRDNTSEEFKNLEQEFCRAVSDPVNVPVLL